MVRKQLMRFMETFRVPPMFEQFSLATAGPSQLPTAATPITQPLFEQLQEGVMRAVPKTKVSYARRRTRLLHPSKELKQAHHTYPCPKCEKGYLKIHHHLCVCKLRELGIKTPQRDVIHYGNYQKYKNY